MGYYVVMLNFLVEVGNGSLFLECLCVEIAAIQIKKTIPDFQRRERPAKPLASTWHGCFPACSRFVLVFAMR